jgi:5-methyltetrahydrofolate--homocysteine methyltransferase
MRGGQTRSMETVLKGTGKKVVVSRDRPTAIIGERINPTGKKRLAAALTAGDLSVVKDEAVVQVEAGAHILDVNVGAAGVDEVDLLPRAVRLVLETAEVPLCIDSPNVEALDAALALHQELNPDGRPLINSVNGEEASLERVLPLVVKYRTAVVGLCMDDDGIPETPDRRLAVAKKIIERAEGMGIPRDSVIIDCLALTMGADSKAGLITLEAIRMVQEELGVNLVLGASNASFGLPDRDTINAAFFAMAVQAGATALIMDPAKMGQYVLAADLALGRDEYAMNYIRAYRRRQK